MAEPWGKEPQKCQHQSDPSLALFLLPAGPAPLLGAPPPLRIIDEKDTLGALILGARGFITGGVCITLLRVFLELNPHKYGFIVLKQCNY